MSAIHHISDISFEENRILLSVDGKTSELPLDKVSKKLKEAADLQRKFYKVSPSGYGIHWPLIDEDLSLDAILKFSAQK